jgi:exonuclease SbcD
LRVYIREPARAGLRDEVLEALPNALEIRIDTEFVTSGGRPARPDRTGRNPLELFNDFCAERQIADSRLDALFSELLDELTSADAQGN